MADGHGARPPAGQPAASSLQTQMLDWITIWHSELAAMATDRELQESWVRLVGMWAQTAERAVRLLPAPPAHHPGHDPGHAPGHELAHGPAGPPAPAGPAPAVAAPDAGHATINRLAERVAELERQLAALGGPTGHPRPEPDR